MGTSERASDRRDAAERQREKTARDNEEGRPNPREVAIAIGIGVAFTTRKKGLMRLEGPLRKTTKRPDARTSVNGVLYHGFCHLLSQGFDPVLSLEAIRHWLYHRDLSGIEDTLRRKERGLPTVREEKALREKEAPRLPRKKPSTPRIVTPYKPLVRAPHWTDSLQYGSEEDL